MSFIFLYGHVDCYVDFEGSLLHCGVFFLVNCLILMCISDVPTSALPGVLGSCHTCSSYPIHIAYELSILNESFSLQISRQLSYVFLPINYLKSGAMTQKSNSAYLFFRQLFAQWRAFEMKNVGLVDDAELLFIGFCM